MERLAFVPYSPFHRLLFRWLGIEDLNKKRNHANITSQNKDGKSVLHSGESTDDWGGDDLKRDISPKSTTSHKGQERRGSILSLWGKGKDERGRDILIHD